MWVVTRAPAFSWGEVPSPDLAFDYVLLLGALLTATDLAYIEVKFTPLGASWPLHLLLLAVLYALLAFRFDSRVLWLSVAVIGATPLLRATTARRFPPAHRLAFAGALVVLLGAGYLALNLCRSTAAGSRRSAISRRAPTPGCAPWR